MKVAGNKFVMNTNQYRYLTSVLLLLNASLAVPQITLKFFKKIWRASIFEGMVHKKIWNWMRFSFIHSTTHRQKTIHYENRWFKNPRK